MTELSATSTSSLTSTAQSGAANYPGTGQLAGPDSLPAADLVRTRHVFEASVKELSVLPPLVFAGEVDILRERLAAAAQGKAFLLQGGDCAETFEAATADKISARVRTILQMAVVLTYGAAMPVIKMGRMAGQFAKPRSSNDETRDGVTLPAYRGDIVNGYDFTPESRAHDAGRMLQGVPHLRVHPEPDPRLHAGRLRGPAPRAPVEQGLHGKPGPRPLRVPGRDIDRAIKFMASCGADFEALKRVEFYASHEALLLDYERALTRIDSRTGFPTTPPRTSSGSVSAPASSTTRTLTSSPASATRSASSSARPPPGDDALRLIDKLDPDREPGRLTFITRMGADNIREKLPSRSWSVTASGAQVLWVTDPMHGNTVTSPNGYKTRNFDDVIDEVRGFFEVHHALGTVPGGLHVEMTGDDVAECLGGADPIDQEAFLDRYESVCDPRLNHIQSLEMAFLVAGALSKR